MNFASNLWSATLNNYLIVNSQPISKRDETLDLGDIDAVWIMGWENETFGENYLLFDNYRVAADIVRPLPCAVELLEITGDRQARLSITGQRGLDYVVDASANLVDWTAITTNTVPDEAGSFEILDADAAAESPRFYRARAVWP